MVKQLLVLALLCISMYLSGGMPTASLFLHAEAVLIVFGGTFLLTWAAYPIREILHPIASAAHLFASRSAIALGALTSLLDLIRTLGASPESAELTHRIAFSLVGLFYGLLLSKVILAPVVERLSKK